MSLQLNVEIEFARIEKIKDDIKKTETALGKMRNYIAKYDEATREYMIGVGKVTELNERLEALEKKNNMINHAIMLQFMILIEATNDEHGKTWKEIENFIAKYINFDITDPKWEDNHKKAFTAKCETLINEIDQFLATKEKELRENTINTLEKTGNLITTRKQNLLVLSKTLSNKEKIEKAKEIEKKLNELKQRVTVIQNTLPALIRFETVMKISNVIISNSGLKEEISELESSVTFSATDSAEIIAETIIKIRKARREGNVIEIKFK